MTETFVTIATYTYSSEALIIKAKLESEGIPVFMTDSLTIDIDPLVSNALGGVRLKVKTKDEAKAKEVLGSVLKYSVSDEGEEIHCPECNSTKIHFFSHVTNFKSLIALITGFLFGALPFYTQYDYSCESCKTKFSNS